METKYKLGLTDLLMTPSGRLGFPHADLWTRI